MWDREVLYKVHTLHAHAGFLSPLKTPHLLQDFPFLIQWVENGVEIYIVGSWEAEYNGQADKDLYDSLWGFSQLLCLPYVTLGKKNAPILY